MELWSERGSWYFLFPFEFFLETIYLMKPRALQDNVMIIYVYVLNSSWIDSTSIMRNHSIVCKHYTSHEALLQLLQYREKKPARGENGSKMNSNHLQFYFTSDWTDWFWLQNQLLFTLFTLWVTVNMCPKVFLYTVLYLLTVTTFLLPDHHNGYKLWHDFG